MGMTSIIEPHAQKCLILLWIFYFPASFPKIETERGLYGNIDLSVILCECETWYVSMSLNKEHLLM